MSAAEIIEKYNFTQADLDRIVEMAWEDRTPFDAIESQFKVAENEVIVLMRTEMKASSFRMWRQRVQGRRSKHAKTSITARFRSAQQKIITLNKMSKR